MKSIFKLFLFLSILFSCSDSILDNEITPIATDIEIINAFPNLQFIRPLDLQSPNDGTNRIFIVEQRGIINVFENSSTVTSSNIFLNIESIVDDSEDEMGLLALAFHPNYQTNGYFYVNYSLSRTLSVVSRFQVSPPNSAIADPNSELRLLEIPQPFTNHNGGKLAFGPDGFLYISSGDGGSAGDPQGNAQNRTNLLGNILRIDIDNTENGLNYAIPNNNPYVGSPTFRNEIFAYGLRNPWRISFDIQTGVLWAGDVGQDNFEEIDIIENGNNYGWNILEGNNCFQMTICDASNLTSPVFQYSHDNGDVSITGGYVYRGNNIPQLQGRYVYGDFVSGRIWSFSAELSSNPDNELIEDTDLNIASFGTDMNNELYICAFDGAIYKFEEN
ncbi:glucose sorbosone dehydrogenase [Flavobacteriaceae bacterium AU392]|nr:glucose sorbosone dehydrogenase [Flavobacteriaceae bacterium]RKM85619.1 glucose sorbosone dehydrogenase [Flavobacteriaceae bacterium AU392]